MPKQTRYSRQEEPEEEGGRRPRRSAPAGPPIVPLVGLVVLIGLAIVAARMYSAGPKAEPEAATQGYVPFASVPEEAPPGARTGGGPTRSAMTDRAPAGLAASAVWQQALVLGAKGDEALARSAEARRAQDSTAGQAAAREARDAYDEAVTITAEWIEGLLAQYGDTDRQVREISRVRNKWFDNLLALHKTTGR